MGSDRASCSLVMGEFWLINCSRWVGRAQWEYWTRAGLQRTLGQDNGSDLNAQNIYAFGPLCMVLAGPKRANCSIFLRLIRLYYLMRAALARMVGCLCGEKLTTPYAKRR